MDPISISTGVLSLVGAALQGAQMTRAFIDGIRGAPRAVGALSSDLAAMSNVLETLQNFLNNIDNHRNPRQALITGVLQAPLSTCVNAMNDIKRELEPFIKPLSGPNTSKWKSMVFTFREKDIVLLQRILVSSQTSLTSAVAVVSLLSQSNDFERVRHQINRGFGYDNESIRNSTFAGSSVQGSDYEYALRRFMLETETINENFRPQSLTPSIDMPEDTIPATEAAVVVPTVEGPKAPTKSFNSGHFPGVHKLTAVAPQLTPQTEMLLEDYRVPSSTLSIEDLKRKTLSIEALKRMEALKRKLHNNSENRSTTEDLTLPSLRPKFSFESATGESEIGLLRGSVKLQENFDDLSPHMIGIAH